MVVFDNGYHEVYADIEREEFFKSVLKWVKETKSSGKTDYRKRLFI